MRTSILVIIVLFLTVVQCSSYPFRRSAPTEVTMADLLTAVETALEDAVKFAKGKNYTSNVQITEVKIKLALSETEGGELATGLNLGVPDLGDLSWGPTFSGESSLTNTLELTLSAPDSNSLKKSEIVPTADLTRAIIDAFRLAHINHDSILKDAKTKVVLTLAFNAKKSEKKGGGAELSVVPLSLSMTNSVTESAAQTISITFQKK